MAMVNLKGKRAPLKPSIWWAVVDRRGQIVMEVQQAGDLGAALRKARKDMRTWVAENGEDGDHIQRVEIRAVNCG